jgi:hypothetical protein
VTGLAENILGGYRQGPHTVIHPSCRGRGDDRCYWTLTEALPSTVLETPVSDGSPIAPASEVS